MTMPAVSVIVPWRDRAELLATMQRNMALLEGANAEYIVVNHGGDANALRSIAAELSAPIRLVHLRAQGFNKSRALNIGLHFATSAHVLLLDADVVLLDFDLAQAKAAVQQGRWVTLERVEESNPALRQQGQLSELAFHIELALVDGRRLRIETSRRYFDSQARSAPGILFAARSALHSVGGFHSELLGWGWEDIDMHLRLHMAGLEQTRLGRGLHFTHGDESRFFVGPDPNANNARNQGLCLRRYDAGDFLGTLERDCKHLRVRSPMDATAD